MAPMVSEKQGAIPQQTGAETPQTQERPRVRPVPVHVETPKGAPAAQPVVHGQTAPARAGTDALVRAAAGDNALLAEAQPRTRASDAALTATESAGRQARSLEDLARAAQALHQRGRIGTADSPARPGGHATTARPDMATATQKEQAAALGQATGDNGDRLKVRVAGQPAAQQVRVTQDAPQQANDPAAAGPGRHGAETAGERSAVLRATETPVRPNTPLGAGTPQGATPQGATPHHPGAPGSQHGIAAAVQPGITPQTSAGPRPAGQPTPPPGAESTRVVEGRQADRLAETRLQAHRASGRESVHPGSVRGGAPSGAEAANSRREGLPGSDPNAGVAGRGNMDAGRSERAQAAQRPSPPPRPSHPVTHQVSVNVKRAVADGLDRITIRLRPENLGRVEVRLEVGTDKTVQARIVVDRPETLDMLRQDSRVLERALQDAGLQADGNSLSFSLREGQGEGRQTAGGPQDGAGQEGGAASDDNGPREPDLETLLRNRRAEAAQARGGVDVNA